MPGRDVGSAAWARIASGRKDCDLRDVLNSALKEAELVFGCGLRGEGMSLEPAPRACVLHLTASCRADKPLGVNELLGVLSNCWLLVVGLEALKRYADGVSAAHPSLLLLGRCSKQMKRHEKLPAMRGHNPEPKPDQRHPPQLLDLRLQRSDHCPQRFCGHLI
jgi:hypothetical protein